MRKANFDQVRITGGKVVAPKLFNDGRALFEDTMRECGCLGVWVLSEEYVTIWYVEDGAKLVSNSLLPCWSLRGDHVCMK